MARAYIERSIDELEKLLKDNKFRRPVLAEIAAELEHRKPQRALSLLRDLRGLLEVAVPMPPPPPRPDRPEHPLKIDELT